MQGIVIDIPDKEIKIKRLVEKYEQMCSALDENKKKVVKKLYTEAAFMEVTLEELQARINKEGAIIETTNGNGFPVILENPAQKSYNTMIRNYNTIIKTLAEIIPVADTDDEL
jgi:PP-loop superfamily ATP-utilizing enzyme